MENIDFPKVLIIEPFYGGSHKVLIDNLILYVKEYTLVTLPPKKWHWRARCSPLSLLERIPKLTTEKILFCSSVLNLAELLGVRPDLQKLKKIVYFHENQLIYPIRDVKERDIQYPYNQIMSSLAADKILFNSYFNKESFLTNIQAIIKLMPDCRPTKIQNLIEPKCVVTYFPVEFPQSQVTEKNEFSSVLKIVWPHRWEFDKGPDEFFSVLFRLFNEKVPFRVSVLGENFHENPQIFNIAKEKLKNRIVDFGYLESKDDYYNALSSSHIVVSTSKHEFFGVSMLEAAYCGCFPLVPNDLVYPEIYPEQCLYSDLNDLFQKLKLFCNNPQKVYEKTKLLNMNFDKFSVPNVMPKILETFI